MYVSWQLDLSNELHSRLNDSRLTGFGSHNDGDLIKGTVAAAAYCCEMGPATLSTSHLRIFGRDIPIPCCELLPVAMLPVSKGVYIRRIEQC